MNYKEIELRDEVELIDGTKTKVIRMREITRGDLKSVQEYRTEYDKETKMLVRLTSISEESLEKMSMFDSDKLSDALNEARTLGFADPKN